MSTKKYRVRLTCHHTWSLAENKFRFLDFLSNNEVKLRKLFSYTTGRQSRIADRYPTPRYVFIHLGYIASEDRQNVVEKELTSLTHFFIKAWFMMSCCIITGCRKPSVLQHSTMYTERMMYWFQSISAWRRAGMNGSPLYLAELPYLKASVAQFTTEHRAFDTVPRKLFYMYLFIRWS